jgi:hypothetical protein
MNVGIPGLAWDGRSYPLNRLRLFNSDAPGTWLR